MTKKPRARQHRRTNTLVAMTTKRITPTRKSSGIGVLKSSHTRRNHRTLSVVHGNTVLIALVNCLCRKLNKVSQLNYQPKERFEKLKILGVMNPFNVTI